MAELDPPNPENSAAAPENSPVTRIRQGVTTGRMRYVLTISIALAIVAMTIAYAIVT